MSGTWTGAVFAYQLPILPTFAVSAPDHRCLTHRCRCLTGRSPCPIGWRRTLDRSPGDPHLPLSNPPPTLRIVKRTWARHACAVPHPIRPIDDLQSCHGCHPLGLAQCIEIDGDWTWSKQTDLRNHFPKTDGGGPSPCVTRPWRLGAAPFAP